VSEIHTNLARRTFFLLLCALLTACSDQSPHRFEWQLQTYALLESHEYAELVKFSEAVDSMSAGRLTIQIRAANSAEAIAHGAAIYRAVSEGRLEMGNGWPSWWSGQHPAWALLEGPHEFSNFDASMLFFLADRGFALANGLSETQGVLWRPAWWAGMELGLLSPKPIRNIDDLKGLRARIGPGLARDVMSSVSEVNAISLVPEEIAPALQNNDLDVVEWTTPVGALDLGINEHVKYMLVPGLWQQSALSDFLLNKNAYDQLPKDLQAILEHAMRSFALTATARLKRADFKAFAQMRQQGLQVQRWSDDDIKKWRKQTAIVLEDYRRKKPESNEIMDEQHRFQREFSEYHRWFTINDSCNTN